MALDSPDRVLEDPDDPTLTHHLKAIAERDNRILRVVVDLQASLRRVVTVFVDRRLSKPR